MSSGARTLTPKCTTTVQPPPSLFPCCTKDMNLDAGTTR